MEVNAKFRNDLPARIFDPHNYKQRVINMFQNRAPSYDINNVYHPKVADMVLRVGSAPHMLFLSLPLANSQRTEDPASLSVAGC